MRLPVFMPERSSNGIFFCALETFTLRPTVLPFNCQHELWPHRSYQKDPPGEALRDLGRGDDTTNTPGTLLRLWHGAGRGPHRGYAQRQQTWGECSAQLEDNRWL